MLCLIEQSPGLYCHHRLLPGVLNLYHYRDLSESNLKLMKLGSRSYSDKQPNSEVDKILRMSNEIRYRACQMNAMYVQFSLHSTV